MKKAQIQITPIFTSIRSDYWKYLHYTSEDIQKINQFFENGTAQLLPLLTNSLVSNMVYLAEQIGVKLHPIFRKKQLDPQVESSTHLIIQNLKIDYCTLKCLNLALRNTPYEMLKMGENDLSQDEFIALRQVIAENKLQIIFFEYNQIKNDSEFVMALGANQYLKVLVIRGIILNDEVVSAFCSALKENETTQLSCLELQDNHLSEKGISYIADLLSVNTSLEFLGLSKNNLQNVDLILKQLSIHQLNNLELESYRVKERERENVIQRNQKQKNEKLREKVPILEKIQLNNDGSYSIIKNTKLKQLNLSCNKFSNSHQQVFNRFLKNCNPGFKIILSYNLFDQNVKEEMMNKHKDTIYM